MKRKFLLVLGVLALGAAMAVIFRPAPPAPEAKFMTLAGETLHTRDFRGKVWLVNFWATTCATCVKEMPALVDLHRKFSPRGFEVVAVAMSYDPPNYVAAFARQRALPFRVALDVNEQLARDFGGVRLTPTSFLVDKEGRIVQQYLGEPDFGKLEKLIEGLLQAS